MLDVINAYRHTVIMDTARSVREAAAVLERECPIAWHGTKWRLVHKMYLSSDHPDFSVSTHRLLFTY